ncbi:hypothetical protein Barb7_02697 [Bacteroidales bacterium Barb7]|nr:hypothetical protein Barb7_02697 [Bacteroidales bacterium Barb7]
MIMLVEKACRQCHLHAVFKLRTFVVAGSIAYRKIIRTDGNCIIIVINNGESPPFKALIVAFAVPPVFFFCPLRYMNPTIQRYVMKNIVPQNKYTRIAPFKINVFQVRAIRKSLAQNLSHAARNSYGSIGRTPLESSCPNTCYTARNDYMPRLAI